MRFSLIITAAAAGFKLSAAAPAEAAAAQDKPQFFLIRHAEKNPDGTISATGMDRAQCLINVFGSNSGYNIQHIMVQTPYDGGQSLCQT